MKKPQKNLIALIGLVLLLTVSLLTVPRAATAATAAEIDSKVNLALKNLYKTTPTAKKLAGSAKGILVFPDVVKAGLMVGGQYGEGALRVGGKTTGYYNTAAASFGLQAGAEKFGYAMFFMDNESLKYLKDSAGWEVGVGPTIVVLDKGAAAKFSTTTAKKGVYAVFFDQKGLMAGLGIEGSKITKITPGK